MMSERDIGIAIARPRVPTRVRIASPVRHANDSLISKVRLIASHIEVSRVALVLRISARSEGNANYSEYTATPTTAIGMKARGGPSPRTPASKRGCRRATACRRARTSGAAPPASGRPRPPAKQTPPPRASRGGAAARSSPRGHCLRAPVRGGASLARSARLAARNGRLSCSNRRTAPSPSQHASAAASWALSRSGNCTFSTAPLPSARVAGNTSETYESSYGLPRRSDHSSAHSPTRAGRASSHTRPRSFPRIQSKPRGISGFKRYAFF